MQTEQMRFVGSFDGAQLHAGNDAHSFGASGFGSFVEPSDGIMIRECECR
jgi:hypothetical protein